MGKKIIAGVGAFAFAVALVGTARATDPAVKCAVSKLKAAGKKVSGKMSCYSKAKAKPPFTVDPGCLAKAETKFAAAFAKAGNGCPGSAAAIESLVDDCVSAFLTADPNDDKCGSSSAKALGKGASRELGCEEKGLLTGGGAPACRAGVAAKTDAALSKAGSCTTNGQTAITSCVDGITAGVPPTTSTTSTTLIPPACCSPERATLVGTSGATQKVGGFAAYPFPAGTTLVMDYGPPDASCKHDVTIPPGGFTVPPFCIPGLQYTSTIEATGCESGTGVGAGTLWDGNAQFHGGVPMTNVSKVADSSDGVCDNTGAICNQRDINVLGDIDATLGVGGAANKLGSVVDIPVHLRMWQDATGCPGNGIYNPGEGDTLVAEWDSIVSPTTGQATAEFADKNADGCAFPGGSAGFGAQCPGGSDGPCGSSGVPADGPCCVVGDTLTTATAGIMFSNSFPMYDFGFLNTIPMTVSSCGAFQTDTCTVTTDACKF
jgi:hypothetical protein